MSVRHAAIWSMGSQYAGFILQFVTSVLVSRFFLTPAEVGLYSIAIAAAMLVAILQDFGLTRYISGLTEVDEQHLAQCSSVAMVFSCLVAGIIALAAWPMAQFYGQPDLMGILLIIAASYFFVPFFNVPSALLSRDLNFSSLFMINVAAILAQSVVTLGMAAMGYSAYSLAWGVVAQTATRAAVAQWRRPVRMALWAGKENLKPILAFGSASSVLYVVGGISVRSPDLIIGRFLGLAATGLYSRAAALSDHFRMLIGGAIGQVFYPAFARIRDRGESLAPAYLRVVAAYTAIIWPGMVGLAVASVPLVHFLYGDAWADVAPLLTFIALSELLLLALPLHTDIPILTGRIRILIRLAAVDTFIAVGLLLIASHYSVTAAAASRMVYSVLWFALYARFMQRIIGFRWADMVSLYARGLLATGAAVAPLLLCYQFWIPAADMGIGALLFFAGLGVPLWAATLVALRHPAVGEVWDMVGPHLTPLKRRFARR